MIPPQIYGIDVRHWASEEQNFPGKWGSNMINDQTCF